MGIYKRKQESKKTRKDAFDQKCDQEKQKERKKTRSRPRKRSIKKEITVKKKRKKTRSRPRKRQRKKEKLLFSYFLVFFYKFEVQATLATGVTGGKTCSISRWEVVL